MSSSSHSNADNKPTATLITDVTAQDVYLGRGQGPNCHAGNIFFRQTIQKYKAAYTATVNRKAKSRIAKQVWEAVDRRGGRFLKPLSDNYNDETFVLAEEEVVMEKIKQGLRHSRCTLKSRSRAANEKASLPTPTSADAARKVVSTDNVATVTPVESRSTLAERDSAAAPPAVAQTPASSGLNSASQDLLTLLTQQGFATPVVAADRIMPTLVVPSLLSLATVGQNVSTMPLPSFSTLAATPTTQTTTTPFNNSYVATLQTLMAVAEERRRSSPEECLQLLELIDSLIAAKRAQAQQGVATTNNAALPQLSTTTTTAAAAHNVQSTTPAAAQARAGVGADLLGPALLHQLFSSFHNNNSSS
jgi:hypothetical protein